MAFIKPSVGELNWGDKLNATLDDLENTTVKKNDLVFDVTDFGAVGDGLTDDTAAIQSAIDAAPSKAKVVLRPGKTYLQTAQLNVTKPLTLSGYGARLTTATTGVVQISVTSGDVGLEGFTLTGPGGGGTTYDSSAGGIFVVGPETANTTPNFANAISNIRIVDVTVTDLRQKAIYAEYVRNIEVDRCRIARVAYSGIDFGSVDGGWITNTSIDTVYMTSLPNSYLIHLTRNKTKPIGQYPRTNNVVVDSCILSNNATWEGIDTHGGTNLRITNNIVTNTLVGIAIVSSPDETDTNNVYAPQNILVQGNYVNSTVTDGSRRAGIQIQGAQGIGNSGAGAYGELAAGCLVIGNTVVGHGVESDSTTGGIQVYYTTGCVVANNNVSNCSPAGINLYHDNYGAVIQGNTLTDTWSSTAAVTGCIWFSDDYNNSHVAGNRVVRGTLTATHVNDRGIYISKTGTNVTQAIGLNDLRGATTQVVDSSGTSSANLRSNNVTIGNGSTSAHKLAFYGGTPIARQSLTAATATPADIIAALAALNLVQQV